MPRKINTLPNKSIHPGSMGFASSLRSAGGSWGRRREGCPAPPGMWGDGMGWGSPHSMRCCHEKWEWKHIVSQPLRLTAARDAAAHFKGWLWSGEDRRSTADASPSKCGEQGVKVTASQQSLLLCWLWPGCSRRNARSLCWAVGAPGRGRGYPRELGRLDSAGPSPAS